MITKIKINNFKSVQDNTLNLGRFNVFIGENGCGKSNLLEAICFASASRTNIIDDAILVSKGARVVPEQVTKSAFEDSNKKHFSVEVYDDIDRFIKYNFDNDKKLFSSWKVNATSIEFKEAIYPDAFIQDLKNYLFASGQINSTQYELNNNAIFHLNEQVISTLRDIIKFSLSSNSKKKWTEKEKNKITMQAIKSMYNERTNFYFEELSDYAIFAPENTYLRIFEEEETNKPLGIKGQGIFKLIQTFALSGNKDKFNELKKLMKLIDWFEDISIPDDLFATEARLTIKDRFLDEGIEYFDQRSSNEGFLFLLFYFSLFISDNTPEFFAIDNVDSSLNPKLCSRMIFELSKLAQKYDKQVILTTHNPAVLDGLSLENDDQRLFVVYRNGAGHTKTRRIMKPEPVPNQPAPLLSDLFMSGSIGGLPRNF